MMKTGNLRNREYEIRYEAGEEVEEGEIKWRRQDGDVRRATWDGGTEDGFRTRFAQFLALCWPYKEDQIERPWTQRLGLYRVRCS